MLNTKLFFLWSLLLILFTSHLWAQDKIPDHQGKEFWIMFNANGKDTDAGILQLLLSSDQATSGVISGPFEDIPFSVAPGTEETIDLPVSTRATSQDEVENKGIHIVAQHEVTVHGFNRRTGATGAFLALPEDVLGMNYIVLSADNRASSQSAFGIVAVEDNTQVTIVPSADAGSRQAEVPYHITLDEGQSYQLWATAGGAGDLTGTGITADKPVSVFGGLVYPGSSATGGHLIEQLPPVSSWGKSFYTVPLAGQLQGNTFRILASANGTEFTISAAEEYSQTFALDRREFQEVVIPPEVYTRIEASKPILVAQYGEGQNDGDEADPLMLLIPPVDQYLDKYNVATPVDITGQPYTNLVVPGGVPIRAEIDGSSIPDPDMKFRPIDRSAVFGAQIEIEAGAHQVSSSGGFGAVIYASDNEGSYGFLGGQALGPIAKVDNVTLIYETEAIQGQTYCFSAKVTDEDGNPVVGVKVDFSVVQTNSALGNAITNSKGIAEFCYTPEREGMDTFSAGVGDVSDDAFIIVKSFSVTGFSLIDAESDEEIQEIKDGGTIDLATVSSTRLSIEAIAKSEAVGSASFRLEGPFIHGHTENYAPYAIFGDKAGDFSGRLLPPGEYTLIATPYTEKKKGGLAGTPLEINFTIINSEEVEDAQVTGFDLYDAVTDDKLMDLEDGTVIHKDELDHNELTVLIHTMPDFVGSVKVELQGPMSITRTENTKPYTLFRNNSSDLFGEVFTAGQYTLRATPYTQANAQGVAGVPLEISFTVVEEESSSARLAVYPVPTSGVVHILHEGTVAGDQMMLLDYSGNVLLSRMLNGQSVEQLDMSSYKKGIYYLKVISQQAAQVKRVVVE